MAFTIAVQEKDNYICKLIAYRLRSIYSDAYICKRGEIREVSALSDFTITLTDEPAISNPDGVPRDMKEHIDEYLIPLYSQCGSTKLIDIPSLIDNINRIKTEHLGGSSSVNSHGHTNVSSSVKGRLAVVLPFTYADDREEYIAEAFDSYRDADSMCIRIDLMWGARMPTTFRTDMTSGSLTTLLTNIRKPAFKPQDILDYLNPDSSGFLTPGLPESDDDVYDIGIDASVELVLKLRKLLDETAGTFNAIIVTEGFRLDDLKRIVTAADELHLVLPEDKCNREGFERLALTLRRQLRSNAEFVVHKIKRKAEKVTG